MRLSYNCHEKHHQFQTDEEHRLHQTCNEIEEKIKKQDAEH